jgi:DNA-binding GntR family transcriptional regulator
LSAKLFGIYQVREVLEGLAAELFATNASTADRLTLRRALDEVRIAYESGDVLTRLAAKKHFYDCLIKGSGNEALGASLHMLNARAMVLRGRSLQMPSRWKASLSELEALLAALEARQPEEARACAVHHVRQAAKTALANLAASAASGKTGNSSKTNLDPVPAT